MGLENKSLAELGQLASDLSKQIAGNPDTARSPSS
jgi:hypothetical protein